MSESSARGTQPIDPRPVKESRMEISDVEAVAIVKEFRETAGLTFEQLIEGLDPIDSSSVEEPVCHYLTVFENNS
jgi:hypothetical protein